MALVMFISASLQSLLQQQFMNRMFVFGMRLKTVLTATIYKKVQNYFLLTLQQVVLHSVSLKALRLSNNARRQSTVGEIVNHMAVDVQRMIQVSQSIQMLWSMPLQVKTSSQ